MVTPTVKVPQELLYKAFTTAIEAPARTIINKNKVATKTNQ